MACTKLTLEDHTIVASNGETHTIRRSLSTEKNTEPFFGYEIGTRVKVKTILLGEIARYNGMRGSITDRFRRGWKDNSEMAVYRVQLDNDDYVEALEENMMPFKSELVDWLS